MERSLHDSGKFKLHIYPFKGEWLLVNDYEKSANYGSFACPNEALNCARTIFKGKSELEVVIHSKYDSMPHFKMTV